MKIKQVVIKKKNVSSVVWERFLTKKNQLEFSEINLPTNIKSIMPTNRKIDPVVMFYRWLGDQTGHVWYDEKSQKTIDVTEVYFNSEDLKFLQERLQKYVANKYKHRTKRGQEMTVGMHWLGYGPSSRYENIVPQGTVYLGKNWLVNKK